MASGAPATGSSRPAPGPVARLAAVPYAGDALALVVLALTALLLHRDGLSGGPAFYERDTQLFYYPLAAWVSEQLKQGVFPLWLPGIFTGYPIFADGELGLLYLPQVLLLWWLPAPLALVWLRVLHAFLAGAFMLVFLRTLRLDPLPALGGALVFAYGSFLSAQMHHENVVRSAIWLPLVLALADRSLRAVGRSRWAWMALAALAFAQSALGLHVQPVLMLALTLGAWVVFRWVVGWPRDLTPVTAPVGRSRLGRLLGSPLAVLVGIGAGGLALAAAQWIPLLEWSRASFRAGGVSYEFASAFGLAAENLPTLIFPYFFRLPDQSTWWSLWQPWETELYVGIPTLGLVLAGLVASQRREALFFLVLGALSLLVAMGHYAPVLNLHELLWSVPGFSFLRAPGRFGYLVVFAAAGLAALGLQALVDRRAWLNRLTLALVAGVPLVALLAALLAILPAWRNRLLADPDAGRTFVQQTYLAVRAQFIMDPALVYQGLVASLDLANPKTAWSLALLAASVLLFVAWLALGPQRARIAQGLFVALLGLDLLVFAADFHPRERLVDLVPPAPPGVAVDGRIFLWGSRALADVEPDVLLATGRRTADGYSSLPSMRHFDLLTTTGSQPGLLAVWAAPYVLTPLAPTDSASASGVVFRRDHPLVGGYQGTGITRFDVPSSFGATRAIALVGTLSYAFEVPQGETVAEIEVRDRAGNMAVLPIRAGDDLAERAADRPSLQGLMRHRKPDRPTALDFEESSPTGETYQGHLYQSVLSLPAPAEIASLSVRPTHPRALVHVHGLGLVGNDGITRSLTLADREGMRSLGTADGYEVLFDGQALPRAYTVDVEDAVVRGQGSTQTPVQTMAGPGFDPSVNVLVERAPSLNPLARGQQPDEPATSSANSIRAVDVVEEGPNALHLSAQVDRPSYLVVTDAYHRGWQVTVDGRPADLLIGNAVFRAVALGPGQHEVVMRFQPLSHLIGAGISAAALLAALVLIAWGFLPHPRRSTGGLTPR